jgi:hypothetical protein
MKRQLPSTSHDAYAQAKPMIAGHHAKILEALKVLGSDTAEGIAKHLCMEHSQVNRRVSEMERLELIYKPGGKKLTKTGRQAFVWCIRGNSLPKTDAEVNQYKKGVKASSDYSKELIASTQQNLFP